MTSHGIRDQVAIVGMGCTPFREHWDKSVSDLLVDATYEAAHSAGRARPQDAVAFWLGTLGAGLSGMTLSKALAMEGKPVTRLENYCATGSEALRNAAYAVACGAYDVAIAVGVEKLKDAGHSGIVLPDVPVDGTEPTLTPPSVFSLLIPAYQKRYGVSDETMREVLTKIAQKSHANGVLNPRAQYRKALGADAISCAPLVAGQLGVLDCSGVADGAAAAVIVRAEDAHKYCDNPLYIKALSFVAGSGSGLTDATYDYTTFREVAASAQGAYEQAGIEDPRTEIGMAEVHDCFTVTELVLMEDLGFCERGLAWKDVLAGAFDLGGDLPVNPDGGLKSFGHPIGASGLRMIFEAWLQLRGEAGDRQVERLREPGRLALTQNLGGSPGDCVSFVSIIGNALAD
jgi:acetyl-CoA C-acetyltransferase